MAWVAVGGLAIAAAPTVYKAIKGGEQTDKSNALNPINPGYRVNQNVLDNARTLSDQYGNYQIPGYSQISNHINSTYQTAFDLGKAGATGGGDILDLATKMAYGKNQAFGQLDAENAQGKQAMLGKYLAANEAAGNEYQQQNQYDQDQYNRVLRQKAALEQAGAVNTASAFDQFADVASKVLLGYRKQDDDPQTMGQKYGYDDLTAPAQTGGLTTRQPKFEDLLTKYGYGN